MEAPDPNYWATLAQVIPVFALALVLEARAIAARWDISTPTSLKAVQAIAWAVALVVLAFGESVALRALRGETPKSYWIPLAEGAISWCIGLLIIGPVLQLLVKSFANPLSHALTFGPVSRIRSWRIGRRLDAFKRSSEEAGVAFDELHEKSIGMLKHLRVMEIGTEAYLMIQDARGSVDDSDMKARADAVELLAETRKRIDQMKKAVEAIEYAQAKQIPKVKEKIANEQDDFRRRREEAESAKRDARRKIAQILADIDKSDA